MDLYSCRLKNRDGSVDRLELGVFADEGQAACAARTALLVSLAAVTIELWRGERMLDSYNRDGAQFRRLPGPDRMQSFGA